MGDDQREPGPSDLSEGRAFRVDFEIPPNLNSVYATNLLVQHTEHEFIISFFEVQPPPLLGSPEQKDQQLKAISSLKGKCLARVVVSPARMREFVQVMSDNLSGHVARFGEGGEK